MKNFLYYKFTDFDLNLVRETADLNYDYNRGSSYFLVACCKTSYFCGKVNKFVSGILNRGLEIWHHSVLKSYFDDLGEVAG